MFRGNLYIASSREDDASHDTRPMLEIRDCDMNLLWEKVVRGISPKGYLSFRNSTIRCMNSNEILVGCYIDYYHPSGFRCGDPPNGKSIVIKMDGSGDIMWQQALTDNPHEIGNVAGMDFANGRIFSAALDVELYN